MTCCELLAKNATVDLKASVFENYHNDREVCYKAVEDYCNTHGVYTDKGISDVMALIYDGFNGFSVDTDA